MQTSVAIVFFNRIEPLRRLVARLSEIKPSRVYLIADGPREEREGEDEAVRNCREFMCRLPWTCKIKCNFAEKNMGCRVRVTSGLDWLFAQEECAIILEDDCIPEPEFFPWAEKMLGQYKDDNRVLSIGGTNLCPELCKNGADAILSKYAMIWGWATWRRAWAKNDRELQLLPEVSKRHHLKKWLGKWRAELYWRYLLSHVKSSWGYRWAFTHFAHEAYCIVPPVNLVENIGMAGIEATHTSSNPYDLPRVYKSWQGGKGEVFIPQLDEWIEDHIFSRSIAQRIKWLIKKI